MKLAVYFLQSADLAILEPIERSRQVLNEAQLAAILPRDGRIRTVYEFCAMGSVQQMVFERILSGGIWSG